MLTRHLRSISCNCRHPRTIPDIPQNNPGSFRDGRTGPRPDHPGRTDGPRPSGPPGTDGRTKKTLKKHSVYYFLLFLYCFYLHVLLFFAMFCYVSLCFCYFLLCFLCFHPWPDYTLPDESSTPSPHATPGLDYSWSGVKIGYDQATSVRSPK